MAPADVSQLLTLNGLGLGAIPLFSFALLLFLALVAVKRRFFSPISDIPGPKWAHYSIFWKCFHIIKGHEEEEIIALHKQHGDFVRISHKEVSVAHPDAVIQLLHSRLHKAEWYRAFAIPDDRFRNQMSELDPKEHIRKNKNIAAGYALSNLLKAEPYVDACIELLEDRLDQLSKAGKEVHFDHWFNYCAFDIVGEITFSKRFGFLKEGRDLGGAIANSRRLTLYIAVIGHMHWLHKFLIGNPIVGFFNLQPSNHVFDTCLRAVDARKKNDKARRDMMEQWLEMRRNNPDRMEEREILAAAVSNIGAGADTISTTLQANVYYLLRHPKHLHRLREEVDAAQNRGELSHIVSHAEAQKLPFLQACIKEAYRFHSAVGLNLPRVAPKEGITIAGRFFPAGLVLSVNPWVIHRNKAIFGEDAESYNPERWLREPERVKVMERNLIHWGAGYNMCPGRNLAHIEISKISATIIRDYDIEQTDPTQNWTFENWFVALPWNWPCRLTRRFRAANGAANGHVNTQA